MKIKSIYIKSIIGAGGLLIATAGFASPGSSENRRVVPINLNAGESYVIKDLGENNTPAVHVIKNPNALIIHSEAPGELVLLGAGAGQWSLDVKTAEGEPVTYKVSVYSIAGSSPIAPGKTPPTLGSPEAANADKSDTGTPLDSGSGPVETASSSAAARKASSHSSGSPNSGAVMASAASVTGAAGSSPAAASHSGSATPADSSSASTAESKSAGAAGASSEAGTRLAEYTPPPAPAEEPKVAAPNVPSQTAPSLAAASGQKFSSDPLAEPASPAEAGPSHTTYMPDEVVELMSGSSRVFDFPRRIRRISVADTEVADIQVVNPYQINLIGHKEGFTTLAVWDTQGHYEERQIRIDPYGKQQVLLNVLVAELDRSRMENTGFNWNAALPNYGLSLLYPGAPGGVATPLTAGTSFSGATLIAPNGTTLTSSTQGLPIGGALPGLLLSPAITYGLASQNSSFPLQTFVQLLEEHGFGKVLAQPHLLANSGEKAEFLSGGEIPIVISEALNTSIVFKQYGTSVIFVPTVVGKDDIEMQVKPEVSQPDYAHGVSLFGFTVPAFVTRRTETFVRLKNNQTLIIAGLILHTPNSSVSKVPYMGDIPYLGSLFRSTAYNDTTTDLMISVTPQIVEPLPNNGEVATPTNRPPLTAEEIRTQRLSEPDASRPRF